MLPLVRILSGAMLAVLAASILSACADAPSRYGAAPVISGVPSGYDVRKEEARGR